MIRVAFDIEHTRHTGAGTARYAVSLIQALQQRPDVTVITVGGGTALQARTVRKRAVTAWQEFWWYPRLGRRNAAAAGAHVYHCPTARAPLTKGKPPLVVTLHDMVPMLLPETMSGWSRAYTRASLRHVLRAADRIVTPSQDTANDLNRILAVSVDRIRVVWNGVAEIFFSPAADLPPERPPYVLFVGTPEPRKNLPRLIAAMELLRSRGFPHTLVVAGGAGWGGVDLAGPGIEVLGRVSDNRLHTLYSQAACVALPSLHEGFGLPAVEAMAAGTPVVAGARGALPEITGDAAVLVDPFDVSAISAGIERALTESPRLIAAGKKRADQFTWARAAENVAAVYRELV